MNVVFDLGDVLIGWNPRNLYRRVFPDLEKMEWFLTNVCHGDWNLAQDAGRSFDDGVKEAISRHPAWETEIELYRDRWMEMVSGPIQGSVQILEELHKKGVALFAITNWNGDTYRATHKKYPFLNLFRDIVVSGDEKIIKPDPAIFNLLAKRNDIALSNSIFIDDSLKNIRGAEAVGMQAHHFTTPEALRADLKSRKLL